MSKEKLCYIAFVYDTELKSTAESCDKNLTCMLSDEHIITVGAERFRFTFAVPAKCRAAVGKNFWQVVPG